MKKVIIALMGLMMLALLFSNALSQTIPFAPVVSYPVGQTPWHIIGGDLNGDGNTDLVTANAGNSTVSILMGIGDGTFGSSQTITMPGNPLACAITDIDGDGYNDIVVANHTELGGITLLINDGIGNFAIDSTYNAGNNAWSVIAVDLDGDSDNDIALSTEVSGTLYIFRNNGLGVFEQYGSYTTGSSSHHLVATDIDNDGDQDLVVAGGTSNIISILFNNGSGNFTAPVSYPCGSNVISVLATDLNGDNRIDLAGVNYNSDDITLLFNNGNAQFGDTSKYAFAYLPSYIIASDLNLDGLEELVITKQGDGHNLLIMQNDGSGNFSRVETLATGNSPLACYSADFDGDDDMDIAVSNISSNNVSILLNQMDNGSGNCALYGRVTEIDSLTPIPDVYVRAGGINAGDTTDISGDYFLDSLRRGPHQISFYHPLYVDYVATGISFPEDDTLQLNVSLVKAGWISGTVIDTLGQPLTGVRVICIPDNKTGLTDSLGRYFLQRLSPGSHNLTFTLNDYYEYVADSIIVTQGETVTLDIIMTQLPPGIIAGVITEIDGTTPIPNIIVNIFDLGISDTTDLNGLYMIAVPSPGPHIMAFRNPYYVAYDSSNVSVPHGETLIVNVSLIRAGWIAGVVSDTTGQLLEGALVSCNSGAFTDRTDEAGEYFLGPLNPGTYNLEFTMLNFRKRIVQHLGVAAGETTVTNVDLFPMPPQVEFWFGPLDGSPIIAPIGQPTFVEVYGKTKDYVYVANLHICLGVQDQYIDGFISDSLGTILPPLNEWDEANFLEPQHSPPNQPGWSSQSFLGFADIGMGPNPYFHSVDPIHLFTIVIRPINDISVIGDTIDCIGPGVNAQLGYAAAGDTIGGPGYQVVQHFSKLKFSRTSSGCDYYLGDINGDSNVMGGDVTYGVRFFKGLGVQPPDSCRNDSLPGNQYLYMSGDVNGNCEFRGSDITRLVAYFKGIATLGYCRFFPPPMRKATIINKPQE
jgi:hypothetical protein